MCGYQWFFKIKSLLKNTKWLNTFCRDALDKIESLVKEMKNKNPHSASIDMGDVIGVIQRQAENAETEDFCYSSEQDVMNVRPEKH